MKCFLCNIIRKINLQKLSTLNMNSNLTLYPVILSKKIFISPKILWYKNEGRSKSGGTKRLEAIEVTQNCSLHHQ